MKIKDSVKRGMKKKREWKGKISGNGKIPRDEKPRGFLVTWEPKLFDTQKSVFHKGMSHSR